MTNEKEKLKSRRQTLQRLAKQVRGLKYRDAKAEDVLNKGDWVFSADIGFWPVTKDGVYTGEVCSSRELDKFVVDSDTADFAERRK